MFGIGGIVKAIAVSVGGDKGGEKVVEVGLVGTISGVVTFIVETPKMLKIWLSKGSSDNDQ